MWQSGGRPSAKSSASDLQIQIVENLAVRYITIELENAVSAKILALLK